LSELGAVVWKTKGLDAKIIGNKVNLTAEIILTMWLHQRREKYQSMTLRPCLVAHVFILIHMC
jgi:hypothetical protein